MSDKSFNIIVIGAGPAGYVAAIRAAQLGLTVACVDDFKGKDGKQALGGTCLNVGCIPSKALLDSSIQFHHITHNFPAHGIHVDNPKLDLVVLLERKNKIVRQFTAGISQLFKANRITTFFGKGRLLKGPQVEITGHDGQQQTIGATHVILAPGSVPVELPFAPFDGTHIVDNAGAMDLDEIPRRLGIIGAGVIGLELGSVWNRLGTQTTLIEAMPEFLPAVDADMAKIAAREFARQGLVIRLGAKLEKAEVKQDGIHLQYTEKKGLQTQVVDKLLVAVGRRANTRGLLADDSGVKLDAHDRIRVDEHNRTGVDGVWAIGDAVRGPMLAHKGSEEGIAVAEWIAGKAGHVNLDTIPWVIYTEPEIAWAGKTENQLKADGVPYRVGRFPFAAIGRAVAMNETVGQIKMLAHAQTDRLLGVHMVGPGVSELIAECVVAMEFKGASEDLARIVHAHPTLSEAVHEAALAVDKRAIHKAN